jgi:four helix bundle protein
VNSPRAHWISENLPKTRAGNHSSGQILRSGALSYPNHGEAEDAESREDFIHKLELCLKELREPEWKIENTSAIERIQIRE